MPELPIMFFWMIVFISGIWYTCGFSLGHTYDFLKRRKTYNGTKALACIAIIVIMYYLPWQDWGIFTQ